MANTFKNKGAAAIGTSEVSVYTCPSSTTSTIIGLTAANLTTTSPMSYTLNGNFGVQDFTAGETITGQSSGATATVKATGAFTALNKLFLEFSSSSNHPNGFFPAFSGLSLKNINNRM